MFAYPQSFGKRYVRSLRQLRWLLLAVTSIGALLIEVYEHYADENLAEFWVEVLFYGLLFPFIVWLLITLLASYIARHLKSQEDLALHRYFSQHLVQSHEWDELTRFLAEFLGMILSADQAALFVYNHRSAQLEFVTDWNAATRQPSPTGSPVSSGWPCQACQWAGLHDPRKCEYTPDPAGKELSDQWCVPLAYHSLLVGVLRRRCRPGQTLTREQMEFLDEASPEIALALALTLSYPHQVAQVRAVTQLEERRQFAWMMHNTLAQQVGALHLGLDGLARGSRFPKTAEMQAELDYLRKVVDEAYELTRDILALLRGGGTANLSQMLENYAQLVAQRAKLKISVMMHGEPLPLSLLMRQHILSLVQEGFNNVEKHARAEHVQLSLTWSADSLSISLVDDGAGFIPPAFPQEGHYGLVMMREHMEALGGELTIHSSPGQGARLNFKMPLQRLQANPEAGSVRVEATASTPNS